MVATHNAIENSQTSAVPFDWAIKELKQASVIIDSLHETPSFSDQGFAMVRVTDIKSGNLNLENAARVDEKTYLTFIQNYKPVRGDIVLSRVGSYGVSSFVDTDEPFCMGQNTVVIHPHIDNRFLYYILNSKFVRQQIDKESFGTGYKSLSLKNVKELRLPIPVLSEEQSKIAQILLDMDALIESLDRLIEKKTLIKQGTMQELLTGKKRLPGFNNKGPLKYKKWEFGHVSEEWHIDHFGDVIENFSAGQTPSRTCPEYFKGDIPWITSGELNYNIILDTIEKITPDGAKSANLKILPKGTFLMAITGLEAEGTRGSCAITGIKATTNQSCLALTPKEGKLATNYLFHYYVAYGKRLALKYCQGTKQQSYTAGTAKALPIILPTTIEEQFAIARVLTDMNLEIEALKRKRDKCKLLKVGLMQQLLTGRIRLKCKD